MKKHISETVTIKRTDFEKILKYIHQYDTNRTDIEIFIKAGNDALSELEETGELHEPFDTEKMIE